jgi:hypothetical protein
MTETEEKRFKAGIPRETIAVDRIWNKRPDGVNMKMPTTGKTVEFVILEFKRMHTGKKCSGSPIRVHKVGSTPNAWTPRMDR